MFCCFMVVISIKATLSYSCNYNYVIDCIFYHIHAHFRDLIVLHIVEPVKKCVFRGFVENFEKKAPFIPSIVYSCLKAEPFPPGSITVHSRAADLFFRAAKLEFVL